MSEAEGEGEVEYDFATQPYVQLFPGDDFVKILARPPKPGASVYLGEAYFRHEHDLLTLQYALGCMPGYCLNAQERPSLEALRAIDTNMRLWDEFWAACHPHPKGRKIYATWRREPEIVAMEAELLSAIKRYALKHYGVDLESLREM